VIIPDLNLLIHAYVSLSPSHEKAILWWEKCLSGKETVGVPWLVAMGFVRLWTTSRGFRNPMTVEVACRNVESWIERPAVRILNPGPRHAEFFFSLLRAEGKGGNLTTDAHIAALAIETNATVHTANTDFLRFRGVKWINPLG
jgi:toxin-antitoxin system PIN domain toxin